jgi:hypothetical protein
MVRGFEDMPAVSALPFENCARVMQRMGENMDVGFTPRDDVAIHPDPAITVVKGLAGHGFLSSKRVGLVFWRLELHGSRRDCFKGYQEGRIMSTVLT